MENRPLLWEKLVFTVSDGGCNFVWVITGSLLTLYYTDSVGISVAIIGTTVLLARLPDEVTDLGIGALIDRIHTRRDKACPWVLLSTIPMGLGLILLFNVPVSLGGSGKIVCTAITHTLMAAVIYTACNLSYNTLLSLTTPNPKGRALMSSLRFFCTMGVVLIINYSIMNLMERFGWNGIAFAFEVIAVVLLLITLFFTKERSIAGISRKSGKEIPVGQFFRLLLKNKYFIFVTLIFTTNYTTLGVNNGLCTFYARDTLDNAGLMGTLIPCLTLSKMIDDLLYLQITRIMGKWKSLILGYILEMARIAAMALTPSSLGATMAGLVPLGIGGIPHTAGLFALVANVINYGEWKTEVRTDGLTSSATSFDMKIGTGLGSTIVGWGLAWGNHSGKLAAQTAETVSAIKVLFTAVPLVLFPAGLIITMSANTDKVYPQIFKDLTAGRSEVEQ